MVSLPVSASAQYQDLLPKPLYAAPQEGYVSSDTALEVSLSQDSLTILEPALDRFFRSTNTPRLGGMSIPLVLSCSDTLSFSSSAEAYRLIVTPEQITLEGRTAHALFDGLQTLAQLCSGEGIACGVVEDAPAFRWRGFLIDVGRNYESMSLLKEQIDVMASLKMNVFHFHPTEVVAWRLESKRHPELNAPETMTRDKGLFYRFEELRELQQYCAERFILFLPEMDMPGHSDAFVRALGYDMQSEEGTATVLDLLDELLSEVELPIIHIGADEVRIHNEQFLPTVTQFLEERSVRAMGWSPGGNYPPTVIRQLWSASQKSEIDNRDVYKVDSRNTYINHMDALESVVSIYNHRILDVVSDEEDEHLLGGELCLWNDRNLFYGDLNNLHNPTYPALIAFAERSWCGGGLLGNHVSLMSDETYLEEFREFEERLWTFRERYLSDLPFPYVPQADIRWQIFGPYDNGGDASKVFPIESLAHEQLGSQQPDTTFVGGTLIYRHFWDPEIKGLLLNPSANQTIYAYRRVWSDHTQEVGMWIGFYDYSRSQWADAFARGEWNDCDAQIWLNGEAIAPPLWAHTGQKGNLEIPFYDENYSMREPTRVILRKGWNTILLKVPVTSFTGKAWYSPVKWMSTAVIVDGEVH